MSMSKGENFKSVKKVFNDRYLCQSRTLPTAGIGGTIIWVNPP
jgi:hypothetical protein